MLCIIVRRWLALLLALLGASMIIVTVYNVQVGMVKDTYQDSVPRYKLDIAAMLFTDDCTTEQLAEAFDRGDTIECARSTGIWESTDIISLAIGGGLLLLARKVGRGAKARGGAGTAERKLRRKRRGAKIRFGLGISLILFGFADMNRMTGPNGSIDWSAIFGMPMPAISMDLSFIMYGGFFVFKSMRFLSRTSEAAEMFDEAKRIQSPGIAEDPFETGRGRRGKSRKFKGRLESLGKANATVADLYGELGLAEYEDEFERGLYDDFDRGGLGGGRTCHLCSGQGCDRCGNTGTRA